MGLLEASNFVEVVQKRQGFYIACLEEIAFHNGWITAENVLKLAKTLEKTDYGTYLKDLIVNEQPNIK
jgi:glucose-1-phosphate thymidylyltransferase